jgi:hypothetical protein
VNLNDKEHGAGNFAARVFVAGIVLSDACSDGGMRMA